MAFSFSLTSPSPSSTLSYSNILHQFPNPSSSFPVSLSVSSPSNTRRHLRLSITSALNPQTKKASTGSSGGGGNGGTNKKRKKKGKSSNLKENWEVRDAVVLEEEEDYNDDDDASLARNSPPTIPKPPAGFVIDETGRVLMASKKRIATVVSHFFPPSHPQSFTL